jgi:hypothetical protein
MKGTLVRQKLNKLVRFNKIMAVLHAVQGLIILWLSSDFWLPVTTSYLVFNESTQSLEQASRSLFEIQIGGLVAAFFFLSAMFHIYIATSARKKYEAGLKAGMNKFRWYEYSLSASIMMVAIAMLAGVYELSLLISIFAFTAIMNLLGLVMEVHNQTTKRTNWLSYWLGCFAGVIPWIIVGIYFWGTASESGASAIPTFVYWIYVSIFIFFNAFAINMVLQYKKVGKWKDYLYGERSYIVLSLVAKSLLAWQVFGGTLQP